MNTDELITHLASDVVAVRPGKTLRALTVGIGCGVALSLVAMLAWLGPRPDLASAVATFPFWMKFFFTGASAALAFLLVYRLARPGTPTGAFLLLLFGPLALVVVYAIVQLAMAPAGSARQLMMGNSWNVCAFRIFVLSLPILLAAFLSLRALAPTQLMLSGAAAGALAGAAGAWVYAFHCDESTGPFLAIWYTLGIAIVGAIGGLFGRVGLRW